jgi:hypothetical protein
MRNILTSSLKWIGILVILVPVAIIITLLIVPFWSWLESASGLESIGHSGPAEWCYFVIYTLLISAYSWFWFMLKKKS